MTIYYFSIKLMSESSFQISIQIENNKNTII
jgi:hypothetical protein